MQGWNGSPKLVSRKNREFRAHSKSYPINKDMKHMNSMKQVQTRKLSEWNREVMKHMKEIDRYA